MQVIIESKRHAAPAMMQDLIANLTAFAPQKGKQRIKINARYQMVGEITLVRATKASA